ncbi:glucose-1-phosphate thymidylyltransferase/glucose-1-phosphate adenylyltransferase [Flavobacteriaceae bacterium MAR_2010_188]|nr:glucose-1-phosphate thymidylyltransferase/glucose-1-phosphate adenylyltransferase [Flavobacteriaceae bacterium MAR_2010_188]
MTDTLIILAGGASSRMKNSEGNSSLSPEEIKQANSKSKGLISIDDKGRPILDYLLFNAKKAGYEKIIFVVSDSGSGHFKELYGEKTKDNDFNGLKISYATQHIPENREKPLGTADAVFQAIEQFAELKSKEFAVCNSDNLYTINGLLKIRTQEWNNALLGYDRDALQFSSERISRFAILKLDQEDYLIDIIEKPELSNLEVFADEKGKLRVSMNIFKFNGKDLFEYFRDCPMHPVRNEKEIPSVLKNFIDKENGEIKVIPISEHVPDLTSKEDISEMKSFINKNYGQLDW